MLHVYVQAHDNIVFLWATSVHHLHECSSVRTTFRQRNTKVAASNIVTCSIIYSFSGTALFWVPLPFHVYTWKAKAGRADLPILPWARKPQVGKAAAAARLSFSIFSGEPDVKYLKSLSSTDLLPVFSMNFHYAASNILPYVCPTYWAPWKGSFGSDTPEPPQGWTYLNSACLCINRINRSAPGYWKASNQIGGICVGFFPNK